MHSYMIVYLIFTKKVMSHDSTKAKQTMINTPARKGLYISYPDEVIKLLLQAYLSCQRQRVICWRVLYTDIELDCCTCALTFGRTGLAIQVDCGIDVCIGVTYICYMGIYINE